ncbi:MAG: DUF6314 family protein [Rhodovulum sp.]
MPELEHFRGHWGLSRVIEDARTGGTARLEGRAVFAPEGEGLRYTEEGVLRIEGHAPLTATRAYLWRPATGGIELFFEDGRFFHAIGPGVHPQALHDCPPDRYEVAYDFAAWPRWSSRWRVTGPRKDYVMTSRYAPGGTCEDPGSGAQDGAMD